MSRDTAALLAMERELKLAFTATDERERISAIIKAIVAILTEMQAERAAADRANAAAAESTARVNRIGKRLDSIAADHATFVADRAASSADREAIKKQLAADRDALNTELTALRESMLDAEQMKTIAGALNLAGRAGEFADMLGNFMAWLRRAAIWLTPLLVVIGAFALARTTLAGWWAELFNGGPK